MNVDDFLPLDAGKAIALSQLPSLKGDEFRGSILEGVARGMRISSFFAMERGGGTELLVLLADDEAGELRAARAAVTGDSFESIAARCPQAERFEREIAEQYGLRPEGHPWMKPLRWHRSRTGADAWGRPSGVPLDPAVGDFYRVEGSQVHEVAVGPVHAGIIEPGHFRFQCHGEEVFHLEIALGYQHRGVERALEGRPGPRTTRVAETVAGDSTVAHASCHAQALEGLAGRAAGARAQAIRGVALELERLANHVGDLGALAGDVGFLPTASFCGRIRGDFLNMTAILCGNRFGRGLVVPGGVAQDLGAEEAGELLRKLGPAAKDAEGAITLLWDNQSVMARFEDTGRLDKETAVELGLVGPAARACALLRDLRFNHPSGIFRMAQVPVSTCDSGDVFARAYVRWLEVQRSVDFIREMAASLPGGNLRAEGGALAPESLCVGMAEGWRGETCHVAVTDAGGGIARYKVVDPSFHNWSGLARALRGEEISDFPLCNKSFNLSYCGHDL